MIFTQKEIDPERFFHDCEHHLRDIFSGSQSFRALKRNPDGKSEGKRT